MKILAVSTSQKLPSAALLKDDGTVSMLEDKTNKPHSVSLMRLVDELMESEGVDLSSVDLFAVDVGPGSFTGVRIGVSAVNAMAFAVNKPVIPVSSLAALRHAAPNQNGKLTVMLDCRNGNGYAARYDGEQCVLEPCACVQADILNQLGENELLIGDCCGHNDACNAELVISEALSMLKKHGEECLTANAVPLYLRPSQAERMKAQ